MIRGVGWAEAAEPAESPVVGPNGMTAQAMNAGIVASTGART